jgi:hypothetical protein
MAGPLHFRLERRGELSAAGGAINQRRGGYFEISSLMIGETWG